MRCGEILSDSRLVLTFFKEVGFSSEHRGVVGDQLTKCLIGVPKHSRRRPSVSPASASVRAANQGSRTFEISSRARKRSPLIPQVEGPSAAQSLGISSIDPVGFHQIPLHCRSVITTTISLLPSEVAKVPTVLHRIRSCGETPRSWSFHPSPPRCAPGVEDGCECHVGQGEGARVARCRCANDDARRPATPEATMLPAITSQAGRT